MQAWTLKSFINRWGKTLVFLLCLIPLIRLIWFGFNDQLTANPIEFITRFTGTWGIVFLCITLSITPLRLTFKWNQLLKYRRMLGLFCFFYALLHFITWAVIDNQLDLVSIADDFVNRTFITLGLGAFVLLIPLAITSTHSMQKRLGRNWAKLHQLIYLIAILVPLHYWVHKAGKRNFGTASIYIAILGGLLVWRITHFAIKRHQPSR